MEQPHESSELKALDKPDLAPDSKQAPSAVSLQNDLSPAPPPPENVGSIKKEKPTTLGDENTHFTFGNGAPAIRFWQML
jgi:hypothetical protein